MPYFHENPWQGLSDEARFSCRGVPQLHRSGMAGRLVTLVSEDRVRGRCLAGIFRKYAERAAREHLPKDNIRRRLSGSWRIAMPYFHGSPWRGLSDEARFSCRGVPQLHRSGMAGRLVTLVSENRVRGRCPRGDVVDACLRGQSPREMSRGDVVDACLRGQSPRKMSSQEHPAIRGRAAREHLPKDDIRRRLSGSWRIAMPYFHENPWRGLSDEVRFSCRGVPQLHRSGMAGRLEPLVSEDRVRGRCPRTVMWSPRDAARQHAAAAPFLRGSSARRKSPPGS